jgi:transcription initiation factor TFIIH subunit 1
MATAHTERGSKLLLGSTNDMHPFDDRGKKVIEKYNRHWAMVLNPNDASAGCDLKALAKKSVQYVLEDDDDAKVNGGFGKEMQRLVGFASADDDHVDHVKGVGRRGLKNNDKDDDEHDSEEPVLFEELNLRNINAYSGNKTVVNGRTDYNIIQYRRIEQERCCICTVCNRSNQGSRRTHY